MEADLHWRFHVDLTDLWRGGLSLRKLSVLIAHLPPESATLRALAKLPPSSDGWDVHAFLLSDLYFAFTGEVHPSRPQVQKQSRYAALRSKLEAQRARMARSTPPPEPN